MRLRGAGAGGRLWRRHLPAVAAHHTILAARECAARSTPDRVSGEAERARRSRAPSGALQVGSQASAAGAQAGGGGGWGGGWGSGEGNGAESVTAGGLGGARALAVAPCARAPARGLGGASAPPRRGSGKKCEIILLLISKTFRITSKFVACWSSGETCWSSFYSTRAFERY